jgi:hypothetical protein
MQCIWCGQEIKPGEKYAMVKLPNPSDDFGSHPFLREGFIHRENCLRSYESRRIRETRRGGDPCV